MSRMTNPSLAVPDALVPLLDLTKAIARTGVPKTTIDLIRLRVSQVNGRLYLLPADLGDADERLSEVATWREASCFTDAERAALALAEAVTTLSDYDDPVPDDVWEPAAKHYTEIELGTLVLQIGLVNLWNRVNLSAKEEPAEWR
jgi:alkylhydroperoxidase family enzyme